MSLLKIAMNGTYYNPAYKHYGVKTNVVCDRCSRSNLNQCIGLDKADLCLKCADELMRIHEAKSNKPPMTQMEQNIFNRAGPIRPVSNNTGGLSKMIQGMFKKEKEDHGSFYPANTRDPGQMTLMMQDMFRRDDGQDNEIHTYMEQDMFKNSGFYTGDFNNSNKTNQTAQTRMMQNMFRTEMMQNMFRSNRDNKPDRVHMMPTMFGPMGDNLIPNEYDDNDMYMSVNPKKEKKKNHKKVNNDYNHDLFDM
jgi:hypothetical protein